MDDDIHSDHSYLDTLGIPLNSTLKDLDCWNLYLVTFLRHMKGGAFTDVYLLTYLHEWVYVTQTLALQICMQMQGILILSRKEGFNLPLNVKVNDPGPIMSELTIYNVQPALNPWPGKLRKVHPPGKTRGIYMVISASFAWWALDQVWRRNVYSSIGVIHQD